MLPSVNLQCVNLTYESGEYVYSPSNYEINDSCVWNYQDVRYEIINSAAGEVVLKFRKELPSESRLLVYVQENVTNRQCSYISEQYLMHSEIKYRIGTNKTNVVSHGQICKDVSKYRDIPINF